MTEPLSIKRQKTGNYFYRDNFHTGKASELEVFSKRGSHLGTANPYTGKINPGTAVKGRSIKDKIDNIVNGGNYKYKKTAIDKSSNEPATAYYINETQYVTVNNANGRVIQVSDLKDKNWIPDSSHK